MTTPTTFNSLTEVKNFRANNSKRETYLYNNRVWFSNFITDEEYNTNHSWISQS
jgi:hypothetical protein